MAAAETVHATGVVLGEAGVLLRGPSGSGKSMLARLLLDGAAGRGRFARLVSDDRVRLEARHGRLVARAVPAIAGRMEARGIGLIDVAHEPAAVVRLVLDCSAQDPPRWPEEEAATVLGVAVPRLAGRAAPDLAGLVLHRMFRGPSEASVHRTLTDSRHFSERSGASAREEPS